MSLKKNNLLTVRQSWFRNLTNLKFFRLKENQIESIDDYSFDFLVNLEMLCISNNKLSEVKESWLPNLTSLTT